MGGMFAPHAHQSAMNAGLRNIANRLGNYRNNVTVPCSRRIRPQMSL